MRRFGKRLAVDAVCLSMTVSMTARMLLAGSTAWMRAASVLDEDGTGGYRFDRTALPGPFDIRAT